MAKKEFLPGRNIFVCKLLIIVKKIAMSTSKLRMFALGLSLLFSFHSLAQDNAEKNKKAVLQEMIYSKQYRFHAMTATTATGKTMQLTSEYYLMLNKDSLDVDLPYYGRAYSADYGGSDLTLQFKSTNFSYSSDTTKKGGWEITITPKNESKANKIYLSVGSGGYGSLNVLSNNRQSISFYGFLEVIKK
jgi:Domain of unknown function (DUF4251)